jgi:hypothetical protein
MQDTYPHTYPQDKQQDYEQDYNSQEYATRFGRSLTYSRKPEFIDGFLNSTMSLIYGGVGLIALFSSQWFLAAMFSFAVMYANPRLMLSISTGYGRRLNRWGLNPAMVTGCALGLIGGAILSIGLLEPAHAQFFTNIEEFLGTLAEGTEGAENMISLVMNTIRGLFIIYMLFSLVQVINAVRQGEEWKDLAKTPFLILCIGTISDVLAGAIAGT